MLCWEGFWIRVNECHDWINVFFLSLVYNYMQNIMFTRLQIHQAPPYPIAVTVHQCSKIISMCFISNILRHSGRGPWVSKGSMTKQRLRTLTYGNHANFMPLVSDQLRNKHVTYSQPIRHERKSILKAGVHTRRSFLIPTIRYSGRHSPSSLDMNK